MALLESAYERTGKSTTSSIKGIPMRSLAWGPNHAAAFKDFQSMLLDTVKLAYPSVEKDLCLFTDASERFWSAVVTQVEPG